MQENEDGKIPALWSGKVETSQLLRKPQTEPNTSEQKSTDDLVRTSKLSVDAKEWFPKTQTNSVQDRLNKFKTPINTQGNQQRKADFEHLKDYILTITCDPGQFEDIIPDYLTIINCYLKDSTMLTNIADFLVEQAISQASFRYNGARICTEIDDIFKDHLHRSCQKEMDRNTPNIGLTLFLAELCTQIECDEFYPTNLYLSIYNLLKAGGDENVKAVCQTLKLTGRALQLFNEDEMNRIFDLLLKSKVSVKNNIINLIDSVVTLRNNNWGQNMPMPSSSRNWNWIPPIVEKPTFYGPDGVELSMDEQKFLDKQCGTFFEDSYLEDPDELCDPEPEMDEEIQAAFREFVKLSK